MRPGSYMTWEKIYASDPLPIGIDRDGCYTGRLQTGQRLILVIMTMGPSSARLP